MPKLNALGLGNEKVGDVDFATMPEQMGGFAPVLYPGDYRFRLPKALTADMEIWDTIDASGLGPRLNVLLEDAAALTIVQSPGGTRDGESYDFRISAVERNRSKKGDPEVKVSDLDYLLQALGETTKPKTNKEYAQALMKHAGGEFTATAEFQWSCNPNKDIRVENGEGGVEVVVGQKGCGARYYQGGTKGVQKVPQDPSDPSSPKVWPERITCGGKDGVACGALLRAFPQLRNFRK